MEDFIKETPRAERRARTGAAINKQLAIAKQHGIKSLERGRVAKKHAMDCGNPKCGLCDNRGNPTAKTKDTLTIHERSFLESDKLDEVPLV